MQYISLGLSLASVIWRREFPLFRGQVSFMADCLRSSMAVLITEVSLVRRAIIERFHCISWPGASSILTPYKAGSLC